MVKMVHTGSFCLSRLVKLVYIQRGDSCSDSDFQKVVLELILVKMVHTGSSCLS